MIHAVTVTNPRDDSLRMELAVPTSSGFVVTGLDGLGPPKATINTSSGASLDGVFYNSSRVDARNLVLNLSMWPNPTIEHSRQMTYRYFPIKQQIKLVVETDNRVGEIYGYVESNDPDIFSREESTSISIICTDPWFVDISNPLGNRTSFYGVEPLFEFEFSNESLVSKLIEMGEHVNILTRDVEYSGDVETGVLIQIDVRGPVNSPVIYNTATGHAIGISGSYIAGDTILINTRRGEKSVFLVRSGVYTNLLSALMVNASWLSLMKGQNPLAITATSGGNNMHVYLEYRQLFEGL